MESVLRHVSAEELARMKDGLSFVDAPDINSLCLF